MKFSEFKELCESYFISNEQIKETAEDIKSYIKLEDKNALPIVKDIFEINDINLMLKKCEQTEGELKHKLIFLVHLIEKNNIIRRKLKMLAKNLYGKIDIHNLFKVDTNELVKYINLYLYSNNVNCSLNQTKTLILSTNLFVKDMPISINLYNSHTDKNKSAIQIYNNLQDYFSSIYNNKNQTFMQALKRVDSSVDYAKGIYDIMWDTIKSYYFKINQAKIEDKKRKIIEIERQISQYSDETFIQKQINKCKKQEEKLTNQLLEANKKFEENQSYFYKSRKRLYEERLSFVKKDLAQLSNPEFIKLLLRIDNEIKQNTEKLIEELYREDFKID